MLVTYYLSYDVGCVRIPYPMKKKNGVNQHPEDILPIYRCGWKLIPEFPDNIRREYGLGFGDFVVVEEEDI